jgi:hypothetical protein
MAAVLVCWVTANKISTRCVSCAVAAASAGQCLMWHAGFRVEFPAWQLQLHNQKTAWSYAKLHQSPSNLLNKLHPTATQIQAALGLQDRLQKLLHCRCCCCGYGSSRCSATCGLSAAGMPIPLLLL